MKNIFKGWEYINALFQLMQENNPTSLIAPKYIYRGITKRHFTSSTVLESYLIEHPKEKKEIEDTYSSELEKLNDSIDKQKLYYGALYQKIYNEYKSSKRNTIDKLRDIVRNPLFYCVKPEYIRSGAAVRLTNIDKRTQSDYLYYLNDMIAEMKRRYPNYRNINDLDILAEIQHKGGASCLVDFSTNFLVGLWFATQDYAKEEKEMGYLFCYDINSDLFINNTIDIINSIDEKPIEELLYRTQKSIKYNGRDDYKFLIWKPTNINNRIIRQDSIFVFGMEKFKVADHPIIILPIPSDWKEHIQQTLKHLFGISSETIYADVSGYASSNTKLDSCGITSSYFNDDVLKYDFKLKQIEFFQRGMSCIVKKKYELALQYLYNFENWNREMLDSVSNSISYDELYLFNIEFIYSKALCYHRLNKLTEARNYYEVAFRNCLCLVKQIKHYVLNKDFIATDECEKLRLHTTNKFYKILDDYIDVLFKTQKYDEAFDAITDAKTIIECCEGVDVLLATAMNEIRLLKFITSKAEYIPMILDLSKSTRFNLFCKLLNELFLQIVEIINCANCIECYNNAVHKAFDNLNNIIGEIKGTCMYKDNNDTLDSLFSLWDMEDIKAALKCTEYDKPIKNDINSLIEIVEECRNYIDGTKWVSKY